MAPVTLEPSLPEPRPGGDGLDPDQLVEHLQILAEWGHENANRVLDWQDRERSLGPCLRLQSRPAEPPEPDVEPRRVPFPFTRRSE